MTPAKFTARFINGNAFKPADWGDAGLPIVRIAQLSGREFDNYYDGDIDEKYCISDGDLLFAWSATIDSFLWTRGEALLNQHIFRVLPKDGVSKRFLYYSLKHYSAIWADIDAHGSTTRHIKKGSLSNKIHLPDIDTQRCTADFLDYEVGRIDELIARKRSLSELLYAKMSITIDRAVSLGVNSNVAIRESSMPWLPQIPANWKVRRAKYLFREANTAPLPDDRIVTAFRDGEVTLRENRRTEGFTVAIKEVGYQHIDEGDLVIHTMDAFAGAIGVSDSAGKATGEYAVCKARSSNVNNHYYAHVLRAMARRDYIYVLCPSVRERAPRFRFVRFAPVFLPFPPREEQDSIVEFIKNRTAAIRNVKDKNDLSIDRLLELRSALITNAVTGKLDVAAWRRGGAVDSRLDQIEREMSQTEARA